MAERRPLTPAVVGAAEERNEQTSDWTSPLPRKICVESPSAVRALTTEHVVMAAHLRAIGIAEKHVHPITSYLWEEHDVFVPSDLGLLEDDIIAEVVEACDLKTVSAIKLRAACSKNPAVTRISP